MLIILFLFKYLTVVDCQVSPWGPWSDCDAECGSGTMSRTRTIQVQPENGGRHCPSLQQRRGCQVSNCHHQDHAIKGNVDYDYDNDNDYGKIFYSRHVFVQKLRRYYYVVYRISQK